MKSYGHLDLNQNQLQNAALPAITDFPPNPVMGQVAFINKTVYICVDLNSGTPIWYPLTKEIESYTQMQDTASTTWTIVHNLNTTTPNVQVYEQSSNMMVVPDQVTIVDNNTLTATFGAPIAGRASVIIGSTEGSSQPVYAYTYVQVSLSDSWIINHGLGYYPIIRVFIGNQEAQPLSITHNSNMQATITFSSPQTGVARCI